MADGRVSRALQQGKARTSDIKTRVPELRERVPELRERVPELRQRSGELARHYAKIDVSWARCGYAKAARAALLSFGLGPMIDWYVRNRVVGDEVLDKLPHPVIFVANHSSHLDTPTLLRALPPKWRRRTAVAAAADYFYKTRWKASGVALLFNTVPLGRKGEGLGSGATDHVDRILDEGWNLVMFPEGTRSRDGKIGKVHSGAAVIAAQHGIPIVPIYLSGTHQAMPPGQNWPRRLPGPLRSRRHEVEARFGDPIHPRGTDEARDVMDRVRVFWEGEGLTPVPPPARARAARLEPATAPRFERDPAGVDPVTAPVPPAAPVAGHSGTRVS